MLSILMKKAMIAGVSSLLMSTWPLSCFDSSTTTLQISTQDWQYDDNVLLFVTGIPGQQVQGDWQSDLANPVGSVEHFGPTLTNDDGAVVVANGRLNANWYLQLTFDPPCTDNYNYNPPKIFGYVSDYVNITSTNNFGSHTYVCAFFDYPEPDDEVSPAFSTNTSYPSSITVRSNQPLTSAHGMPLLRLYGNGSSTAVVVLTATSISSDGMHATFPYPLLSGSTLPPNLYSWSLINQGPSGHRLAGNDWLAVGQADTGFATPFGVDAGSYSEVGTLCHPPTGGGKKGSCNTVDTLIKFPIVTLYNLGELKYNGEITDVGTHPTVVRAYNKPVTKVSDSYGGSVTITQTGNALVVNTGSNSVSIVNLVTHFIVATIAVGSQPVDARVSSDNSTAYVVNYGSGTVTVISLTSNIVTNTISVGSHPTTISLDGNGNAWIGGNNFVAQLNLSSFAITSHAVNGLVNGIAYSNGQGQVLTTIAPSTDSSSLSAISYRPGSGYLQAASVTSSGALSAYSNSSMDSELLWPAQLSTGVLVSNQLNNMIGVTVSGASFAVTDLHSGAAMLTGQAPGTIRGLILQL